MGGIALLIYIVKNGDTLWQIAQNFGIGMDALLATVQMPPGVPVATVGINGAANAAHLAAQILALSDPELTGRMNDKREAMRHQVRMKDAALQEKLAQSGQ